MVESEWCLRPSRVMTACLDCSEESVEVCTIAHWPDYDKVFNSFSFSWASMYTNGENPIGGCTRVHTLFVRLLQLFVLSPLRLLLVTINYTLLVTNYTFRILRLLLLLFLSACPALGFVSFSTLLVLSLRLVIVRCCISTLAYRSLIIDSLVYQYELIRAFSKLSNIVQL